MFLQWKPLEGADPHASGIALLTQMYHRHTGNVLPPISRTDRGKPYFVGENLHFSISHTKNMVFCCLHEANVGMDAEGISRAVDLRLAEKWLSPAERQRLQVSEDKNAAFLRLWVLKESYAKLTGRGIGSYLKETDFSPDDPRIQTIAGCYVAVMTE